MSLYKKAIKNPSAAFSSPDDLLKNQTLSDEQKINILQQWYNDASQLEVAAEENMGSEEESLLPDIIEALHSLGSGPDIDDSSPTK